MKLSIIQFSEITSPPGPAGLSQTVCGPLEQRSVIRQKARPSFLFPGPSPQIQACGRSRTRLGDMDPWHLFRPQHGSCPGDAQMCGVVLPFSQKMTVLNHCRVKILVGKPALGRSGSQFNGTLVLQTSLPACKGRTVTTAEWNKCFVHIN